MLALVGSGWLASWSDLLYPWTRRTWYPLYRRLDGPQTQSRRGNDGIIPCLTCSQTPYRLSHGSINPFGHLDEKIKDDQRRRFELIVFNKQTTCNHVSAADAHKYWGWLRICCEKQRTACMRHDYSSLEVYQQKYTTLHIQFQSETRREEPTCRTYVKMGG
jgi:hypothetical protein